MFPVNLWVYDLSGGLAKLKSREILGFHIEGIWHTSVVVFGWEYYYSSGIRRSTPGTTHFGKPVEVINCGETTQEQAELEAFLKENNDYFTRETYNLLDNNCNHFSNAVCLQLLGQEIPRHILDLPLAVKNSPFGVILGSALTSGPQGITGESFLNVSPRSNATQNRITPETTASVVPTTTTTTNATTTPTPATPNTLSPDVSPGDDTARVSSPDSG